jgi:hypothetical protein
LSICPLRLSCYIVEFASSSSYIIGSGPSIIATTSVLARSISILGKRWIPRSSSTYITCRSKSILNSSRRLPCLAGQWSTIVERLLCYLLLSEAVRRDPLISQRRLRWPSNPLIRSVSHIWIARGRANAASRCPFSLRST